MNYRTYDTSNEVEFKYERTWTYNDPTGSPSDPSNQHTTEEGYTLTLEPKNSESRFSSFYAGTLQKSGLNLCNNIKTQCDALVPFLNVPQEWYDRAGVEKDPIPATMIYNFTISVKDREKVDTVQVTVTWDKKNVTLSRGAAINGEAGNA